MTHCCCHQTICLECWDKSFDVEGGFTCRTKCGYTSKSNPKRMPNVAFRYIVEQMNTLRVFCDTHPSERVSKYSVAEKRFLCSRCESIPLNKEVKNVIDIDENMI